MACNYSSTSVSSCNRTAGGKLCSLLISNRWTSQRKVSISFFLVIGHTQWCSKMAHEASDAKVRLLVVQAALKCLNRIRCLSLPASCMSPRLAGCRILRTGRQTSHCSVAPVCCTSESGRSKWYLDHHCLIITIAVKSLNEVEVVKWHRRRKVCHVSFCFM